MCCKKKRAALRNSGGERRGGCGSGFFVLTDRLAAQEARSGEWNKPNVVCGDGHAFGEPRPLRHEPCIEIIAMGLGPPVPADLS